MAPIESDAAVRLAQEELVKVNLKVKGQIERFDAAATTREMEALNAGVRAHLAAFRAALDRLRELARAQKDARVKSMLLQDVEGHAAALAACHRQFKVGFKGFIQAHFKISTFDNLLYKMCYANLLGNSTKSSRYRVTMSLNEPIFFAYFIVYRVL